MKDSTYSKKGRSVLNKHAHRVHLKLEYGIYISPFSISLRNIDDTVLDPYFQDLRLMKVSCDQYHGLAAFTFPYFSGTHFWRLGEPQRLCGVYQEKKKATSLLGLEPCTA